MRKDARSGKIYILSLFGNYSIQIEVESDLFQEKSALEVVNALRK